MTVHVLMVLTLSIAAIVFWLIYTTEKGRRQELHYTSPIPAVLMTFAAIISIWSKP